MKKVFLAALFAVFAATASIADASVLGDILTFDGELDVVVDDSAGIFYDADADGLADLIQGVVHFTTADPGTDSASIFSKTGGSLFGVYSIALTAETDPGDLPGLGFFGSGFAAGDTDSVETLLGFGTGTGVDNSGLAGLSGVSGTSAISLIEVDGEHNLTDWRTTNGPSGKLALEFDYGSGFTSDLSGLSASLVAGFGKSSDWHEVSIFTTAPLFGSYTSGFSVLSDVFGGGVKYLDVDDPLGSGREANITVDIGTISVPTRTARGGDFGFSDRGEYHINAVPEPTSVAIWGVLAIGGYGFRRRRRA